MSELYAEIVNKYNSIGLENMANELLYIEFDRYDGVLSIEEICVLLNYMLLVSANGETIMKMIMMNPSDLKNKLAELEELGF